MYSGFFWELPNIMTSADTPSHFRSFSPSAAQRGMPLEISGIQREYGSRNDGPASCSLAFCIKVFKLVVCSIAYLLLCLPLL